MNLSVPPEIAEKVFVEGRKNLSPHFRPRRIAASLERSTTYAESRLHAYADAAG